MSGQDSIRGYLFQSIIAVLTSLDQEWNEICIEPKTKNDKVDIIWTHINGDKNVCQVKSSINNFSQNEILDWIINLYNDCNDAISYRVDLIGNPNPKTKEFFKNIKDKELGDFPNKYQILHNIKDILQIRFYPFDIETLEGAIISLIDKFLSIKKIQVDYFTKQLISGGLVNQFIKFSTSGKNISRKEFEDKLFEWLKFNYSEQFLNSKTDFKLSYYFDKIDFKNTISNVNINEIDNSNIIKSIKIESIKLFEQIEKYNFKVKTFEKSTEIFELGSITAPILKNLWESQNEPVIIEKFEIEFITKLCEKYLKKTPSKEFFNFGKLSESKIPTLIPFRSNKTYNGSENEKKKKELYSSLYWKLIKLEDLMKFWAKISKISILPIVLTNSGNNYEEEIKIQLYFPKQVKLYKTKNFPIPKLISNIKEMSSENSLLSKKIKHKRNSFINEYYSRNYFPQSSPIITSYPFMSNDDEEFEIRKYRLMLNYHFDYIYHYDNPNMTIVECEINNLNTKDTIALPTYIFIKSKIDFTFDYKITCKNSPETIIGSLYYKASS